jgi:hypothetical protein
MSNTTLRKLHQRKKPGHRRRLFILQEIQNLLQITLSHVVIRSKTCQRCSISHIENLAFGGLRHRQPAKGKPFGLKDLPDVEFRSEGAVSSGLQDYTRLVSRGQISFNMRVHCLHRCGDWGPPLVHMSAELFSGKRKMEGCSIPCLVRVAKAYAGGPS